MPPEKFIIRNPALGIDASRVAMFYACRNDWSAGTQKVLIDTAYWLQAESTALLLGAPKGQA